jgi:shikimate kinase
MKKTHRFERIVLVGFKGCGKTAVGKLLAKKTGYEFLDIDSLIESAHKENTGEKSTVRNIYKNHGADHFQKLEAKAILEASKAKGAVVSLGGASPLNPKFDRSKFRKAAFVHLDVPPETLFKRITKLGFPPFFDKEYPRRSFDVLFEKRTPAYRKLADFTVENSKKTPARACQEILDLLNEDANAD